MVNIRIWHKTLFLLVILLLPVAALGYLTISTEVARVAGEQQRLAALQYIQGLRNLLEHLQEHRKVTFATLILQAHMFSKQRRRVLLDILASDGRLWFTHGSLLG